MPLVADSAHIPEWRAVTRVKVPLTHKQMHRDSHPLMTDKFALQLTGRRCRVLALPVKHLPAEEVAVVTLRPVLVLLVQGHQQNVHVRFLEDNMTRSPVAGVKLMAEQRRDFVARKQLPDGEHERIQHCTEAGERAHALVRLHVLIVGIRRLQDVASGRILRHNPQKVLIVA